MKNLVLSCCFLLVVTGAVKAQNYCPPSGMPDKLRDRVIQNAFLRIVTPFPGTAPGNYAKLDVANAELTGSASWFIKNATVLNAKLTGGVTEGVVALFADQKISKKVGAELGFSFLTHKNSALFDVENCSVYHNRLNQLRLDSAIKVIEAEQNLPLKMVEIALINNDSAIRQLESRKSVATALFRDSISVAVEVLRKRREALHADSLLQAVTSANARKDAIHNWYVIEQRRLQDSVAVFGYQFKWFTIGGGATNAGFKLFDVSMPLASQVRSDTYLSWLLNVRYSGFRYEPAQGSSYFWSGGVEAAVTDNLTSLTKVSITDTRTTGTEQQKRDAKIDYTAYEGAYKDQLRAARVFFDYYNFVGPGTSAALHVFPEHVMKKSDTPVTNLGLGLLLGVANAAKVSETVFLEIFVRSNDLFNVRGSDIKRIKRSDIGVVLSIPINLGNVK